VGAGRPPKITPLHPTRTPVQFSKKTGPKAKPHNSLLPAAKPSPQKPVNFSPGKKSVQSGFVPAPANQVHIYIL